jgi:hypothetical protein
MKKFIRFPKIGQFRQVIKAVVDSARYFGNDENGDPIFDATKTIPTLTFEGTVKLHGTNAGVSVNKEGEIWAQSRENIIDIKNDNAGFAFFVESNKDIFKELLMSIDMKDADFVTIFGEWCGGSIQKGVAINGLDKMFVVFAVKLSYIDIERANFYLKSDMFKDIKSVDNKIYNTLDFKKIVIEIDFNNPAMVQNKMIEITTEIENECPVGKAFGKIGIGEGVVYKHYKEDGSVLQFKVKGGKHAGSSKVKKLQIVDTEKLESINEFVDYVVTEERLNQGIEKVFTMNNIDMDIKKMGEYLRWIMSDVVAEEMDTMKDNKLEPKDVGKFVSNRARNWFLKKWNEV